MSGDALGHDFARCFLLRLDADLGALCVDRENNGELPLRHVAEGDDGTKRLTPIATDLDRLHRTMEAAALVVGQQTRLQRLTGRDLQTRIERGANRQAALIERVVAVFLNDLPADFLGEEIGGEEMRAAAARVDTERLLLGFFAVGLGDVAVLDHAVDHPVAAFDGGFGLAERMVVGRSLRERCEIGGLGNGKLGYRLVEIGQRRTGNTVGIQAEEDLVEIEFKDPVLAVGLLDAERKDRFLDLAVDRLVRAQQEVLCHLLRDRRCANRATAGTEVLQVHRDSAGETCDIDTRMLVEVFVFGGDEGCLDAIRNRLDRQIETPLTGIFRHQRAIAGMKARRYRRRVFRQHLVVR